MPLANHLPPRDTALENRIGCEIASAIRSGVKMVAVARAMAFLPLHAKISR